jgi:hypothetical protein
MKISRVVVMSNPLDAYFTRMIAIFGSVDALAEDFVITKDTATKIIGMPEGPGKESAILGALRILPEMKKRVTTDELKTKIDQAISKLTPVEENPSGGRRKTRKFKKSRLMSRKYCKKTSCKKMGFTQKASCRPYKNCY